MGKIKFLVFALLLCLIGCSKSSTDEATEQYTYDKILGRWVVTAFYSSGGYYVPSDDGEYYEFTKDKTYIHYNGRILNETENGIFSFNPETYTIFCKEPRGWDFSVQVSFTGDNKATFDIKGKTTNQTKTIKVERQ